MLDNEITGHFPFIELIHRAILNYPGFIILKKRIAHRETMVAHVIR